MEEKIIMCGRLEKESINKSRIKKNKVNKTLCFFVSIIALNNSGKAQADSINGGLTWPNSEIG